MKRKRNDEELQTTENIDQDNPKKKRKIHARELKIGFLTFIKNKFNNLFKKRFHFKTSSVNKTSITIDVKELDNMNDELLSKIFREDLRNNKYYKKSFHKLFNYFDVTTLNFLVVTHLREGEYPKLRKEMEEWIYCHIFNLPMNIEKRKIEKEHKFKNEEIFIEMLDVVIPFDIIMIILKYSRKGYDFLNSVGLLNSSFYLCSLMSWEAIYVSEKNSMNIPILVLNSVKFMIISCENDNYVKNIRHVLSNIRNCRKLRVIGSYKKFFTSLRRKPKIILKKVEKLDLNVFCDDFFSRWGEKENVIKKKVRSLHTNFSKSELFPDLKALKVPNINLELEKYQVFSNLEKLKLSRTNFYPFGRDAECVIFPKFITKLKNLKTFKFSPHLENGFKENILESIHKMNFLQNLGLAWGTHNFSRDEDSTKLITDINIDLKKYIFSMVGLKVLSIRVFLCIDDGVERILSGISRLVELEKLKLKFTKTLNMEFEKFVHLVNHNIYNCKNLKSVFFHVGGLKGNREESIRKIAKVVDEYAKYDDKNKSVRKIGVTIGYF